MSTDDTAKPTNDLDRIIADAREQAERARSLDPATPVAIRGYDLIRELHRGGQGVVYLAHQRTTHRNVAVKLLREGPFAGPGERARFEREVQILAALQHPNIVAIHDSGSAGGNYYFVMDYIAGLPLDAWADRLHSRTTLPPAGKSPLSGSRGRHTTLLTVFVKICDALNVAHQRGVIHRDLKPTNIRVAGNDEPFVLDFGLAKLTTSPSSLVGDQALTATGQFLGTLPWASPEQVEGKNYHADIRTDIYGLGLMLYRALTGRMPYALDSSVPEMIRVITQVEPSRPRSIVKSLDEDLETIVLKCLRKDPDRRYQTVASVAEDLGRYLRYEPIGARRESSWYSWKMFARRHWVAVGVTAGLILLLACASVLLAGLYIRARASERLALERERETRKVAEFQAAQLQGIDAQQMGRRMKEEILKRAAANDSPPAEGSVGKAALPSLEAALQEVNFTDLALTTLDEQIFARALKAIEEQFAGQPLVRAALLQTLATTLRDVGLLEQAAGPQATSLELRRTHLGESDLEFMNSLNHSARLNRARGETATSLTEYRQVFKLRQNVQGVEHPQTLATENELAGLLLQMERLEEAEAHVLHVYDIRRRTLESDNPLLISSQNELANIHFMRGDWDKAIEYFRSALDSLRRIRGPEHAATQSLMNNLASALTYKGDGSEASKLFRELLVIRRRTLGESHPQTLSVMDNLANSLAKGHIEESLELRQESLKALQSTLGKKHPRTLNSLAGLCHALLKLDRFDEAAAYVEQSLALHREVLGDEHSETILAQRHRADYLAGIGKLDEAIVDFRKALKTSRRVLGEAHPDSITARIVLGGTLHRAGKLADAESILREALDRSREKFGDTHSRTLNAMHKLAGVLVDLKRYPEAQELYAAAREGFSNDASADSARALSSALGVGLTQRLQGQFDEAWQTYSEVLAASRRTVGEDAALTLEALNRMGELEIGQGKLDDARARLRESVRRCRAALGLNHRETWRSQIHLVDALTQLKQFAEAEAVCLEAIGVHDTLPAQPDLRALAVQSIIALYQAWDGGATNGPHAKQLAKWRARQAEEPQAAAR